MLSKAGLATLVLSVTILVLGRVFGLPELFILSACGFAVLLLASAYVLIRRLQMEVSRALSPPRVHAGSPCRVDLQLRNRAPWPSPVLHLRDEVSGTRGVELMVAPLKRHEATTAVYRLPTDRRGLVKVGPLQLTVTDPFGLMRLRTTGDRDAALLVYPRVDQLQPLSRSAGNNLEKHRRYRRQLAPAGDEFYGLRQYVRGDDLRRVHWASSARNDELMVRQDEVPWHGRVTVLLDTRQDGRPEQIFEEMVSAAASLCITAMGQGDQVRLTTTSGLDTGYGGGDHHLVKMLEALATVQQGNDEIAAAIERLSRGAPGGAVVAVLARSGQSERNALVPLAASFGQRVLVLFSDGRATPVGDSRPVALGSTLVVEPGQSFAEVWNRENLVQRAKLA